ncbi:hypothetical protein GALMADRAFT_1320022 [Galerina marginata CBS 339.88]|uniref:Uncharacterized protein n=1 Tax=Galerina marginata (strain CBS 339.88) TaxID=685588 RepID=A0A067THG6_GALM3|nr:hypothetical protein GALMADRAFT_1320022 [Galerina marginata CBS 339.88]
MFGLTKGLFLLPPTIATPRKRLSRLVSARLARGEAVSQHGGESLATYMRTRGSKRKWAYGNKILVGLLRNTHESARVGDLVYHYIYIT